MDSFPGTEAARRFRDPVVAIGNFDGVHLGHRRLLDLTLTRARALGGEAVVLTFEPHPAQVLAPDLAPPLLETAERKRELIAEAGMDALVSEPFTHALAGLAPELFLERFLVERLAAREVVVGYDFTYGHGRRGTTRTLANETRFSVHVVPQVTVQGLVVSSTKIREFLHEGNVAGARLLLGRDHDVDGTVVHGAGRGRTIGVPTANVAIDGGLLPRRGVYAVRASVDGGPWLPGAANVGTNPTFTGPSATAVTLEVHLIDFSGEIYGRRMRVAFHARLRGEERFPSVETLVDQIRRDVARARIELVAEETR